MSAGDRAQEALPVALQLVDAVKRWDRKDVAHVLDTADLPALAVVLAAMVNDDAPLVDLLSWTADQPNIVDGWDWQDVLAAKAEAERYRYRGLEVPANVLAGVRVYDRVRARRRRAALQGAA